MEKSMAKDDELKERMSKLSDEELLNIVEVESHDYRKEALDYAKVELAARGIEFQEAQETSDEEVDSTGSEPTDMRMLVACKNIPQAGMLKELLIENGIACEVRGEYLSMALGQIPFTECYPEIWVAGDEDFERAREILDEWESQEPSPRNSWICQGCGQENEGQFGSCWNCGRVEPASDDQPQA
ncbi:MAG: hypothetical protein DMF61_22575 [Blastocatellia bacterium AA13]|nr:MAG: hypothetical protein DMF61_22575 [Blastocatellia bacterium AA13]